MSDSLVSASTTSNWEAAEAITIRASPQSARTSRIFSAPAAAAAAPISPFVAKILASISTLL